MPIGFDSFLNESRRRVDDALDRCLPPATAQPARLAHALRYSIFNGGKRVRAILLYATASIADAAPAADSDHAACAVELVHAYSLIHDDLPAMDNDDLRRGQPTCHIQFDEATAILCGDAMQSLAFTELAKLTDTPPDIALRMVGCLAEAIGFTGMVGGQALDLLAETSPAGLELLEQIHQRKTGALISASVELGALVGGITDTFRLEVLRRYALAIGLAFQVQDDILDVSGSTAKLGKSTGADEARRKSTYCSLLGLEGARAMLRDLHQQARAATANLGQDAATLNRIADYIVDRDH